jgi:hypothetical protein
MLGPESEVHWEKLLIPLAQCRLCHGRFRVLPFDLPPHKHFSLPVIERAARRYTSPDSNELSLRRVAAAFGLQGPCHSTLHRWTAGLGERALDRNLLQTLPAYASLPPVCSLLEQTARNRSRSLFSHWQRNFPIPPWKYRTQKRQEQLQACARLASVAAILFSQSLHPLTAWQTYLIERFHVAAWNFPTPFLHTNSQHPKPKAPALSSRAAKPKSRKRKKPKTESSHETRAPPSRLLAIRANQPAA